MRSAYDLIRDEQRRLKISNYQIAKKAGYDQTFTGRALKGAVPIPDRLRLVIADLLDLDPEDLRTRLVLEREGLDIGKVRAVVTEPPPVASAADRSLGQSADQKEARG